LPRLSGEVTFFTLSDERFFVGTTLLVNSLRLNGHDDEVMVMDLGLADAQRAALERVATLVDKPGEWSEVVFAYKPFAACWSRAAWSS
jgi:hypothetical protein